MTFPRKVKMKDRATPMSLVVLSLMIQVEKTNTNPKV